MLARLAEKPMSDVSSVAHEAVGLPDEVEARAFSPDGRHVAARTEYVIRIWRTRHSEIAPGT